MNETFQVLASHNLTIVMATEERFNQMEECYKTKACDFGRAPEFSQDELKGKISSLFYRFQFQLCPNKRTAYIIFEFRIDRTQRINFAYMEPIDDDPFYL